MSYLADRAGTGRLLAVAIVACSLWSTAHAQNRIIGGYEATIEDFPFQLGLEGGGRHICGGSILTRDWALTAAHCIYDQPVRWLAFRAGSSLREKGGTVHQCKYYIYHEMYTRKTLDYDVAVVRVKVPFDFKTGTLPITLPNFKPSHGEPVTVSGWGFLEKEQLRKPKQLMASDIYVVGWDDCKKLYPALTPRMMCAGDPIKDICNGDSGGPLIRGSRQQLGIVSWGYKCADGLPSVYTNITEVVTWIRASTGLDDYFVFPD